MMCQTPSSALGWTLETSREREMLIKLTNKCIIYIVIIAITGKGASSSHR